MKTIRTLKKLVVVSLCVAVLGGFALPAAAQWGMGQYCQTPAGVFGPGMPLPLGSSCFAYTRFGTVWGYIV